MTQVTFYHKNPLGTPMIGGDCTMIHSIAQHTCNQLSALLVNISVCPRLFPSHPVGEIDSNIYSVSELLIREERNIERQGSRRD